MSLFADVQRFVHAHRPCGELTYDAGEPTPRGYWLCLDCSCGAVFDRCVTPEDADEDLLRSRLLAFPN
ncbi:MAG: hypothetical protein ACE5JD_03960 [Candidatus Methylomirabilia bacterium]